ncbi:mitochondrial uncoupling protein 4 [Galendromus occidentalis]|uniref:Mitochondrial uncoupling protein 4 n=1 Tax=Galendromus occidentalis TaxID=34638 RepID=A0AAJ6VWK1_9ACAR|nr:mitochondrial uncoupling protein 4 [Galendromus occidentalis]
MASATVDIGVIDLPSIPELPEFYSKYALSVLAASTAEVSTYPLDIVKTRMQIQGEDMARQAGSDSAKPRGFFGLAMDIVRKEGPLQLWRGFPPTMYRHIIYTGSRMTIYESIRDVYLVDQDSNKLLKSIGVGVFAGALGQFMASPVDLVKVRMQMDGRRILQGLPPRVTSTMQALRETVKEGGVRAMWKGGAPNVCRAALVNLGDLTTYDWAKTKIITNTDFGESYSTHALASACSGLVSAVLATPADVVRTRVMNQPTDEFGRGVLYKGSMDCFVQTATKEGPRALYKGFLPIWGRMAPWSFIFWLSYEELRRVSGLKGF